MTDDITKTATMPPTVERLMILLAHAVELADGWYDDASGGQIPDDALMEEARQLVSPKK